MATKAKTRMYVSVSRHNHLQEKPPAKKQLIMMNNNTQSQAAVIDRRRGCSKRKSYTVDFKLKTLKLLDSFSELETKKKWENVAEKQGINKSLVVKWNKNREKLQLEIKLNRRKKNAGNLKDSRKKRKLVCEKAKNSEKYPLAAVRVICEFKLRRAGGCKVSKLWLRKKMKAKIEICHGKEEADKFKGSKNWFQRLKKRHGISLRRTSNKMKDSADDGRETIQMFHLNLRKAVKSKRRTNSTLDAKYGR